MSASGLPSVGAVLREAREAQGITLEDAAVRLRLMHRQVEAMEMGDFESLGRPVFARGFVRNYARLLGLAPEALLERMEGAPAEPTAVRHADAPEPRSWLTSPWLILLLLGLMVVVAAPVGLYLWLNSEVEDNPGNPRLAAQLTPEPAPVAIAQVSAPAASPAAEQLPVVEPPTPAVEQTSETSAPTASEPSKANSVVHLEFHDEAWVEIKDASGRMLHRQLDPAGSSVDIQGQPPFDMVIGNASQVFMTYNGRPIDLKPFIEVTVARFTLEE
jgi:cytoskeleton protein RodZ